MRGPRLSWTSPDGSCCGCVTRCRAHIGCGGCTRRAARAPRLRWPSLTSLLLSTPKPRTTQPVVSTCVLRLRCVCARPAATMYVYGKPDGYARGAGACFDAAQRQHRGMQHARCACGVAACGLCSKVASSHWFFRGVAWPHGLLQPLGRDDDQRPPPLPPLMLGLADKPLSVKKENTDKKAPNPMPHARLMLCGCPAASSSCGRSDILILRFLGVAKLACASVHTVAAAF